MSKFKAFLVLIVLQQSAFGCSESSRKPVLKPLQLDLSKQEADKVQLDEINKTRPRDKAYFDSYCRLLNPCQFEYIAAQLRITHGITDPKKIHAFIFNQEIKSGRLRSFAADFWAAELRPRPLSSRWPVDKAEFDRACKSGENLQGGSLGRFLLLRDDPVVSAPRVASAGAATDPCLREKHLMLLNLSNNRKN